MFNSGFKRFSQFAIYIKNFIKHQRLLVLVAIIIPVLVFLVNKKHLQNEKALIDAYQKQQLTTIHYLKNSVEAKFEDIYSDLTHIKYSIRANEATSEAMEEIRQFYASHDNVIQNIYMTDSKGHFLFGYPRHDSSRGTDISNQEGFIQPRITGKAYLTGISTCPYDSTEKALLLSLPLYDKSMNFIGVVMAGIDLREFWTQSFIREGASNGGEIWIVDDNGRILYHPNPEYLYRTWAEIEEDYRAEHNGIDPEEEEMEDIVRKRIQDEKSGTIEYKNNLAGGTIELVAFTEINILNRHFSSAIVGNRDDLSSPINKDYLLMAFMILLLVVLFVLFGISSRWAIKARLKLELEKQKSAEIQRLSELNRMIVESIPSPLAIINDKLIIEYVNFGFTKKFNAFREPMVGKSIIESIKNATTMESQHNLDTCSTIRQRLTEYLNKRYEQPVGFEIDLLCRSGTGDIIQTLSFEIIGISGASGKSGRKLLISITDISEPRRDEKTAKARASFLEALVGLSEITEIARTTFDFISTLMPCDAGFIALLNSPEPNESSEILYRFDTEASGDKIIETNRVINYHKLGENLHHVMTQGRPVIIHRTPEEIQKLQKSNYPIIDGSTRPSCSLTYFPLKTQGRLVGVLSVQSYQYNAFGPEQADQLESISTEAALSLTAASVSDELREKQRALTTLMGNLPGMAYRCRNDIDWTMEFLSEGCYGLTGYTPDEFITKSNITYNDIIHPDDKMRVFEDVQEALIKKEPFETTYRIITADNTEKWVWEKGQGIFSNDGAVIALEGFVADITERRLAEEALRESEKRYRLLADNSLDIIWTLDLNFRFTYISPSIKNMLGYTVEEAMELTVDRYLTVESFNKLNQEFKEDLELEKVDSSDPFRYRTIELEYIRKDGSKIWAEIKASYLRDNNNNIIGFVSAARDISKRKRAEDALKASEERYRNIFEHGPLGIVIVDSDLRFTKVNSSFCNMLGYTEEELMNMTINDITHPEDMDESLEKAHRIFTNDVKSYSIRKRYVKRNGEYIWANLTVAMLNEDSKNNSYTLAMVEDITDHKRAEEALALAGVYNRSLIEASLDPMFTIGPNGKITDVNAATEKATGFNRNQLIGTDFSGYFTNPEKAREGFLQVFHDEKVIDYALDLRHKSGSVMSVLYNASVYRDDAGQVIGIFAAARDITGRKKMEDALKLTQYGIDHSDILIFWIAPDGHFINVNEVASTMLGFTKDELQSMTIMDIDTFITPQNWLGLWTKIKLHGNFISESDFRKKDGGHIPVEVNINYQEFNGQEYHFVFARDITELRNAQETLRRLGTAVEQSAEAIVISDAQGNIQYVNPAFEEITGYKSSEAIGQNPRILRSNKHDAKFYKEMWDTITRGETWKGHIINKKKSGELYEEDATISPIRDGAGKIINYVSVKRDVTQEVALENQLRHSQKLEAIGQLAGGIAHDFNNLLTAINGYSELTLERLDDSDPMKQDVEEIKKAGERAASLTRQLLAFSRRQMLQPKTLNLNSVVVDMNKMMQRVMGENIDIKLNLAGDLGNIKADISQVEQIVMNLSVNARDAMPHGGKLIIETSNVNFDDNPAVYGVEISKGRYIKLSVSDTGYGMDEKTRSHIFEPFFTTKDVGKGTGLGLSTVYGIVQQSGGQIMVESEAGVGTVFSIFLPRSEEVFDESSKDKDKSLVLGGTETILLVEDEDIVRDLAFRILSKAGYKVLQASHPGEAIAICSSYDSPIQLIITDIIMPGMNGKQVYDRVSVSFPNIKVLFMSGHTDKTIIKDGALDSTINFIAKPFKTSQLLQKVREILTAAETKTI